MIELAVLVSAVVSFSEVLPAPLETPPFDYILNESVWVFPDLVLVSSESNNVVDYEEWFRILGNWPAVTFHNGGVNDAIRGVRPPRGIDPVLATPGEGRFYLYQVIFGREATIAVYGSPPNRYGVVLDPRIMVICDPLTLEKDYVFDFLTYAHSPGDLDLDPAVLFQQIRWADVRDGVLYVSNAHRTYAESSGGQNAYITAIALDPLELLWRSQPLVANAEDFLVIGDAIVTGYGFTGEDDFIYELDRTTGEVVHRMEVPSAPEYLYAKDDTLYVRCYDTDLVYEMR